MELLHSVLKFTVVWGQGTDQRSLVVNVKPKFARVLLTYDLRGTFVGAPHSPTSAPTLLEVPRVMSRAVMSLNDDDVVEEEIIFPCGWGENGES